MTIPDPTSSAEEVLDVFRDECRSMVEGRADLLDGILDDSFTAQHITGYVLPKAEWLDQIRSGDFVYHSIRDEGTSVDVQDGSATVVSRAVHEVTLYGHRGRYRLRSTLHYALTPGGWKAVRSSSTTF
jgi:hypothetical protein